MAREWDSERPCAGQRSGSDNISWTLPAQKRGTRKEPAGGSNSDAPCATDYPGERTPAAGRRGARGRMGELERRKLGDSRG